MEFYFVHHFVFILNSSLENTTKEESKNLSYDQHAPIFNLDSKEYQFYTKNLESTSRGAEYQPKVKSINKSKSLKRPLVGNLHQKNSRGIGNALKKPVKNIRDKTLNKIKKTQIYQKQEKLINKDFKTMEYKNLINFTCSSEKIKNFYSQKSSNFGAIEDCVSVYLPNFNLEDHSSAFQNISNNYILCENIDSEINEEDLFFKNMSKKSFTFKNERNKCEKNDIIKVITIQDEEIEQKKKTLDFSSNFNFQNIKKELRSLAKNGNQREGRKFKNKMTIQTRLRTRSLKNYRKNNLSKKNNYINPSRCLDQESDEPVVEISDDGISEPGDQGCVEVNIKSNKYVKLPDMNSKHFFCWFYNDRCDDKCPVSVFVECYKENNSLFEDTPGLTIIINGCFQCMSEMVESYKQIESSSKGKTRDIFKINNHRLVNLEKRFQKFFNPLFNEKTHRVYLFYFDKNFINKTIDFMTSYMFEKIFELLENKYIIFCNIFIFEFTLIKSLAKLRDMPLKDLCDIHFILQAVVYYCETFVKEEYEEYKNYDEKTIYELTMNENFAKYVLMLRIIVTRLFYNFNCDSTIKKIFRSNNILMLLKAIGFNNEKYNYLDIFIFIKKTEFTVEKRPRTSSRPSPKSFNITTKICSKILNSRRIGHENGLKSICGMINSNAFQGFAKKIKSSKIKISELANDFEFIIKGVENDLEIIVD